MRTGMFIGAHARDFGSGVPRMFHGVFAVGFFVGIVWLSGHR